MYAKYYFILFFCQGLFLSFRLILLSQAVRTEYLSKTVTLATVGKCKAFSEANIISPTSYLAFNALHT